MTELRKRRQQRRADWAPAGNHQPAGEWCCRWRSSPPSWPCAPAPCGGGGPAGRSGSPSASSPHWWPCVASLCGWSPAAWPRCSRMRAHNQESEEPGDETMNVHRFQKSSQTRCRISIKWQAVRCKRQRESIEKKRRCYNFCFLTPGGDNIEAHAVNTSCSFVIFCWLDRWLE